MEDLVQQIINQIRKDIFKSFSLPMPAEVVSVDRYKSDSVISVKPCVSKVYEDNEVMEYSTIHDLFVMNAGGSGGLSSVPISIGDNVLVIFCEYDLDNYHNSRGGTVIPADFRKRKLTDAMVFPIGTNRLNNLNPNPDDFEIKYKGSTIQVKKNGNINIFAAKDLQLSAANDIDIFAGGNVSISSDNFNVSCNQGISLSSQSLTHNGVNIGSTHTHGGVDTGSGSTQGPQ